MTFNDLKAGDVIEMEFYEDRRPGVRKPLASVEVLNRQKPNFDPSVRTPYMFGAIGSSQRSTLVVPLAQ